MNFSSLNEFMNFGSQADVFQLPHQLILPTTTTVTLSITEAKAGGPFALGIENTVPFDYFGLPAISVPCGFSKNGLPLGLQIVGPKWGEGKVLDIAYKYQKSTRWHLKHPNITT